ncbi:MAG: hypothetical protein MJZ41_14980 [Bacteroidaceae bacterium]|nr:hypothetical protein [Bacteroidaceae bacterium]
MAQLIDILKIERERTDDNRNVINLFQEGSFYRAYEWSAWLCSRFIRDFKVTNKNLKNIETPVCFVGFPITRLHSCFARPLTPSSVLCRITKAGHSAQIL